MKKDWVKQVVRNIVHEISKELNIDMQVNDIKDFETNSKVEFEMFGSDLVTRSLYVHYHGNGYTVSHGIHSPAHTKSDLIQTIVVGRVAQRFFYENYQKPTNDVYYQPLLSDEEWNEHRWFNTFDVYRSFENAKKEFPNNEIGAYSGEDIVPRTFLD